MKLASLQVRPIGEAQARLETAVRKFVNRAEWSNPYSAAGRQYRARVNELRVPLAELHLARRKGQS